MLRFDPDLRPVRPVANNQTERNLRTIMLKENICGRFLTLQGAKNFAINRSVANIAREPGSRALEALAGPGEFFVEAHRLERAELRKRTDSRPNREVQGWNRPEHIRLSNETGPLKE